MAHFFRAPDRRQRFLLPLDMMEWLPEDDIVHLMVDAVGLMDLSKFEATCKVGGAGRPPFAPAMLLTVLIHAYSHGVRSSRVIERLCRRDAGYRFIVGDEVPDHTAMARFRQRHVGEMKGVFLQVLDLCREAGLIRLGLVALDGTKVKANAGLDANRTANTIGEQVSRMLAEAETTDAQEDCQRRRHFGAPWRSEIGARCGRAGAPNPRIQIHSLHLPRLPSTTGTESRRSALQFRAAAAGLPSRFREPLP
jgi:transposase